MFPGERKQPRTLYLLFLTELWERFGFYTVQAIIILYMTQGLLFSDTYSYLLYGTLSSMLYLTPVLGGYLADRYLGFQRSIFIGSILLLLGYFILSYPDDRWLFLGLSFVIAGNGFFKPNVSSLVGTLYREGDPRRDGGFTLFYMGINVGALVPPLIVGSLVVWYGWHAGFLLAAGGMIICIFTVWMGRKGLSALGGVPLGSPLHSKKKSWGFYSCLLGGLAVAIALFQGLFHFPQQTGFMLIAASLSILVCVLIHVRKEKGDQKNRLMACLILIVIAIAFWALYSQTYTSLMLYAQRNVDRRLFGWLVEAEFVQSFNPFFIVLLSPILSRLWLKLEDSRKNFATPTKFSLGIFMMGIGFLILEVGGRWFNLEGLVPIEWLFVSYFFQTLGELFLSPIGLAMVTSLAPRDLVGMMMGIWFLTQSAAFAIGGELATFSSVPAQMVAQESLQIYNRAFLIYGLSALILAGLSALMIPYIKRLIHGDPPSQPIK